MTNFDRTIWGATCDNCLTNFSAWPHPDSTEDILEPVEWVISSTSCPVCDEWMEWAFEDPMQPYIRTGYAPQEKN